MKCRSGDLVGVGVGEVIGLGWGWGLRVCGACGMDVDPSNFSKTNRQTNASEETYTMHTVSCELLGLSLSS